MGQQEESIYKVLVASFSCKSKQCADISLCFYCSLWHLVTDSLPPQDAAELVDDLGIEYDSAEHAELEKGPLCSGSSNPLKRKR